MASRLFRKKSPKSKEKNELKFDLTPTNINRTLSVTLTETGEYQNLPEEWKYLLCENGVDYSRNPKIVQGIMRFLQYRQTRVPVELTDQSGMLPPEAEQDLEDEEYKYAGPPLTPQATQIYNVVCEEDPQPLHEEAPTDPSPPPESPETPDGDGDSDSGKNDTYVYQIDIIAPDSENNYDSTRCENPYSLSTIAEEPMPTADANSPNQPEKPTIVGNRDSQGLLNPKFLRPKPLKPIAKPPVCTPAKKLESVNLRQPQRGISGHRMTYEEFIALLKRQTGNSASKSPTERYTTTDTVVGQGAHAKVLRAFDNYTNRPVAIKQLLLANERNNRYDGLLHEVLTLKTKFRHPNIVQALDFCLLNNDRTLWVVMEYCDGGNLANLVSQPLYRAQLTEARIAAITHECLQALDYLHKLNPKMIHRDVKSDNILLTLNGQVKLGDFGYCADATRDRKTVLGTRCWMAPEICATEPYNEKVDTWAMGITVWEMIEGEPPFYRESIARTIEMLGQKKLPKMGSWDQLSFHLQYFLNQCLNVDSHKRASAAELLATEFIRRRDTLDFLKQVVQAAAQTRL